jgi:hypothetical protein
LETQVKLDILVVAVAAVAPVRLEVQMPQVKVVMV